MRTSVLLRPVIAATIVATAFLSVGLPTGGALGLVGAAVAADPASADPGATPAPTPDPAPVDPTVAPSADPTAAAPTDAPTGNPVITPDPSPSLAPLPTPSPERSLSPGQQQGSKVGPPLPRYPLILRSAILGPSTGTPHLGAADFADAPDCAACHSSHTAKAAALLSATAPQSSLCYTCHRTGDTFDVQSQFAAAPTNDPNHAAYYQHPVAAASATNHVLAQEDEFGGVSERHAVCADCHNPHQASSARPVQVTTGWTASGDIADVTGVRVANHGLGSAPTYDLISQTAGGGTLQYEYQLCLKCHSGYTVLPKRTASHPSWWALDKGVEFDPANASYHPVEAGGKNLTAQMANSLAGTSPFKAWNLSVDSTVRCTMCHGDPSTVSQTATSTPLAPSGDAYEASHGSPNRGILTAPYKDRTLKAALEPYAAGDSALCYLCHAEKPFISSVSTINNESPTARTTEFPRHGFHMTSLGSTPGGGTSIDTPGDGEGLATCAECHFRIHSTAESYLPGDTEAIARTTGNSSLVDFAPDVLGFGSTPPMWTRPNASGVGSCTLECHGFTHLASDTFYTVAPGTGFAAAPTSGSRGSSGLVVQFVDATRYASTSTATWLWDFGDSTTSTQQSPAHIYTTTGIFTVTLTVTRNGGGSATTMTRTAYITVNP